MKIIFTNLEGTIDIYMDCLRAICGSTSGKSMIDIGCCFCPNTPTLGFAERTYIDIIDRKLDHADEQKYFIKADIFDYFKNNIVHFDVSLSLDSIEHLTLKDGAKLLKYMEFNSDKQIIFTPYTNLFGFAEESDSDPEAHRSLWNPEMTPDYASIVFPDYHKGWNGGAYFFYRCENIEQDFERVINELRTKTWYHAIQQ